MILYVETNFIIELAFTQEEYDECRSILDLTKAQTDIDLVLPVFCMGEAYEASVRKWRHRRELSNAVSTEVGQLGRSKPYRTRRGEFRKLTGLLVRSIEDQQRGLEATLGEVLETARVLPLERATFERAMEYQKTRSLQPQDSIVYVSVMTDLDEGAGVPSCFITRNPEDFANPDIEDDDLARHGCKLLTSFRDGLGYVRGHLGREQVKAKERLSGA